MSDMQPRPNGLRRWAVAVSVALGLGLSAVAAEPADTKARPKADVDTPRPKAKDAGRALRIAEAFRELQGAVEGDEAPAGGNAMPARPERTVVAPTVKPADLDALIEKALAESKAPVCRQTTDEEFIRRVYLDVVGKLPTPQQVLDFSRSSAPRKRAKLVDELLTSPEFGVNWGRYWRDVISYRATNPTPRLVDYPSLEKWLAEKLNANAPWDEIVREVLTSKGDSTENGSIGFWLAHAEQRQVPPVEVAGEVSRIFLGVQIQCAQCHDHPSDQWKREQFHEFAAFFTGVRARRPAQDMTTPPSLLEDRGVPRYGMPDLKDPQKTIPVRPHFFLATSSETVPTNLTVAQRRELAASYVTGQDNPWFAKAFVNRVWYALVGEGFYNPIDDMGPTREATYPEVLELLATEWQKGGYDVRWLYRTILGTRAYQREVRSTNRQAGQVPFASNCPSRLRPDQILDALGHALGFPTDLALPGRPGMAANGAIGKAQMKGQPAAKKAQARMLLGPDAARLGALRGMIQALPGGPGRNGRGSLRDKFDTLFSADPSTPNDEITSTIPQALFLMNGEPIERLISAQGPTVLNEILRAAPNDRAALSALYLRVLGRQPNADEVRLCEKHLQGSTDRREAFEDVLWCLINSTEFISRR